MLVALHARGKDCSFVMLGDAITQIGQPKTPRWKRAEDLVLAAIGLVLAMPILALAAIAILIEDGRPILFWDERVGIAGRSFRLAKLRSMVQGADAIGLGRAVSTDDPRITRVGRLLRRLSLDELPQLWFVVRGDMSVVGPRPTIPDQVRRYPARHLLRLRAKPGITGLAQVSGRNRLSWDERIELDLRYIERMSPVTDAMILLRTPLVVLGGIGLFGSSGVTYDYGEHDEQTRR